MNEPATLDELLRLMAQHTRDFPDHRYDCACKDIHLRWSRQLLSLEQLDELRYLISTFR